MKLVNIGILLHPSWRSIAYLATFYNLKLIPNTIIILNSEVSEYNTLLSLDRKYNYSEKFFNLKKSIDSYIDEWKASGTTIIHSKTDNINSYNILNIVGNCTSDYIIFTGGGLLGNKILDLNKKFIHIHPGDLPKYRGSTCFYYSLIEEYSLAASSFIMTRELDQGEIIVKNNYSVNYYVDNDETLFMDYILDPYIRAQVLCDVLNMYEDNHVLNLKSQSDKSHICYYIMHPFLRSCAIKKLNDNYSEDLKNGVTKVCT